MAITERRREAARINGAKSRGPKTAEGKGVSRRNALKHGLAGKGAVLPEDMGREVEAEVAIFVARFKPQDAYERRLVETAALASVRWGRLAKAELERTAGRVRRAVADWDAALAEEVAALAELLGSRPAEAVRRLMRTAEGCDYLADAWEALAEALERRGAWDFEQMERFLRLLGLKGRPGPEGSAEVVGWYEAALAVWEARGPEAVGRVGEADGSAVRALPGPEEARALLLGLAREQVEELGRLGDELWEGVDGPDRAGAPDRALFDGGPEAARLARYMADAERTRRRALAELEAKREAEARERREARGPVEGAVPASEATRGGEGRGPRRNEPGAGGMSTRNEPGAGAVARIPEALKGAWEVPLTIGEIPRMKSEG